MFCSVNNITSNVILISSNVGYSALVEIEVVFLGLNNCLGTDVFGCGRIGKCVLWMGCGFRGPLREMTCEHKVTHTMCRHGDEKASTESGEGGHRNTRGPTNVDLMLAQHQINIGWTSRVFWTGI